MYSPYQRDGPAAINGNYGGDPNYVRSSFRKIKEGPVDVAHDQYTAAKVGEYIDSVNEDDFQQARDLWNIFLEQKEDQIFIDNVAGNLSKALPNVQKETISEYHH